MLIPKEVLNVLGAASKDPNRFQLCGIHLKRLTHDRCSAVATDGKQLTVVTWDEDDWKEYPDGPEPVDGFDTIVPDHDVKSLRAMIPSCTPRPILDNLVLDEGPHSNGNPHLLPFSSTDLDSKQNRECRAIEGTYPDYSSVIHSGGGVRVMFNPYILANQLLTVAKCAGLDKKEARVTLEFKTRKPAEHPMLIKTESTDKRIQVTGMAMPLVKS